MSECTCGRGCRCLSPGSRPGARRKSFTTRNRRHLNTSQLLEIKKELGPLGVYVHRVCGNESTETWTTILITRSYLCTFTPPLRLTHTHTASNMYTHTHTHLNTMFYIQHKKDEYRQNAMAEKIFSKSELGNIELNIIYFSPSSIKIHLLDNSSKNQRCCQ